MALWVDMDQQLHFRKPPAKIRLDPLDHVMRLLDRHAPGKVDMELDEILRPAGSGAQIVEVGEFGMARRGRDEGLPLLVGPFAVE